MESVAFPPTARNGRCTPEPFFEVLPATKSSAHNAINWQPGDRPGCGLLVIGTKRAHVSYHVTEFPTRWDGRAFRLKKAEAGVRRVAGQDAEAGKILALVRDAVLDPPAGQLGISYYRLVAEYAAACGRLQPAEAGKRIEEALAKLGRVPDTYTTATHYSRYHLMILEAAVLGLSTDDF